MARKKGSEVSNLIFYINSHYNCSLRGRLSCISRENTVMCPHVNKKLILLTQDFQGHLRSLISADKLMPGQLRAPWASSVICGFSQYRQSFDWLGPSLGAGTVHPPVPLGSFCFRAFMTGFRGWLWEVTCQMPQLSAFETGWLFGLLA
jgi:hypothetical protein